MTDLQIRSFHALWPDFPDRSSSFVIRTAVSYYPTTAVTAVVWAPPRSLATTEGITVVFFSCGY